MGVMEDSDVETVETVEIPEGQRDTEVVRDLGEKRDGEESEYSPNFKFRIDDKEFEFNERTRGAIKSKEDEEYYRDLYTKAHGLDLVKSRSEETKRKFQETSQQYEGLQNQFSHVQNTLQKLNGLKSDDFGTFQKVWEIPDTQILKRAAEILKTHDDPEAHARAERVYSDRIEMLKYQDQMSRESQTSSATQRQLHEMKMERALMQPDITKFQTEYDRRMGQPGAFVEEVNRVGHIEFSQGRYLDPQVAVNQAFQRLTKLIGNSTPAPASAPASGRSDVQALPNLGTGRQGTSVKKKIRNTDDLRKLAASME